MPTSLQNIGEKTPMGANLRGNGATFKVWAPNARQIYAIGSFNDFQANDHSLLNPLGNGYWAGFIEGVSNWDRYMFYVKGDHGEGRKRDPYAKELDTPFPSECIVRKQDFPWHQTGFKTPEFSNLVIYQLHVGIFYAPNLPHKAGTFLDVILKIPYLKSIGITAIQLLPIQEFPGQFGLGYNGIDYFSPEMDFELDERQIPTYLDKINDFLRSYGQRDYQLSDLKGGMNQLKALVDVSHIYGMAVIFDVVYNHAGGGFDDQSIYFFDFQDKAYGNNNSLYFTDKGHAGGLVFDYQKQEVRSFLIDNARYLISEYQIDGLRYDQVSVIHHDGEPKGWMFCQDLTSTLRYYHPFVLNHAEYWPVNPSIVDRPSDGMGFDTTLTDGLRIALRTIVREASFPGDGPLNMDWLGKSLWPDGFNQSWQFVQGTENHDLVMKGREERMARLADPSNPRSWFGKSRSKVALGIVLTAPGIPMMFMGQEFLEDKQWSDNFVDDRNLLLHWKGLDGGDKDMADYLRFTRELISLRFRFEAFRSNGFRVLHSHNQNRMLIFQRWVPGIGAEVIVIINLSHKSYEGYEFGVPSGGKWNEVFNSDVYENWVNPNVKGNGGSVVTYEKLNDGWADTLRIVIPANSILVFCKE